MVAAATDPMRGLGFLVADINRLMRKEFDRRVRSLGLTRAQWLFIAYLDRQPGCTQSDLAESLQLEKITVSRQAERLVKAGWIERRDHEHDRRAYHLHLTARAQEVSQQLREVAAGLRQDYLQGVAPERRTALFEDLTSIKNNLVRIDSARGKKLSSKSLS